MRTFDVNKKNKHGEKFYYFYCNFPMCENDCKSEKFDYCKLHREWDGDGMDLRDRNGVYLDD